ncbi:MAG: HD-GYP domain-containing protein, partial [Planctomycetota bacterium]
KRARSPLREETRGRLMGHGVENLYLPKKDEQAYYDYVEDHITVIIRDDLLPAEKASQLVYESSSRVMEDTFDDPRSGRNMRRAHTMVEATVLSIMKDPEALWHMTAMASHDYYTYTHCVHVCMFLVTACRDVLGITDKVLLQRVGLGGLFHDIGKSRIPGEILNKPGKLTPEEFEKVKEHPALGAEMVKQDRKMPHAATQIVRHHHEHFDGTGYPGGLVGEGIGRITRLSTIIDVYDALTTKRAYAPAREPYAALDLMLQNMAEQFDEAMLRAFVKFLGPKGMRMELRARWDEAVARALGEGRLLART